jgi:hypothetical protein
MSSHGWIPKVAFFLAATSVAVTSCGGRLAPLPEQQDGGVRDSGSEDASVDGDSSMPDGAPTDERGPPPVPVCTGEDSMCIPPDAGIVWLGASIIKCQPENYVGPWTLLLELLIGTNYQVVQRQVVQEPGFGWTFYDTSDRAAQLTFRVCVVVNSTTAECGPPLKTGGPEDCVCEPTNCELEKACNVSLDDECGGKVQCGACSNGAQCNPMNHSCCPEGFMPDGWGGCVCAPPPGCPLCAWNTTDCQCYTCSGSPTVPN